MKTASYNDYSYKKPITFHPLGGNEKRRLIETYACPGSWMSFADVESYLALK